MRIKSCIDCEERYPGCHDHCERYQQEKAAVNDEKKRMRKEELVDTFISQTKARIWWRMKKAHRR